MATWWLAIDPRCTSYEELRHRMVVAQGWPDLGNLQTLLPLVEARSEDVFKTTIRGLECLVYGDMERADNVMWNLLSLKAHDIIVGIEGMTIRGICELHQNGWESYRYDAPQAYEYAQTVGFPVEWVDWEEDVFGFTPSAPSQLLGVKGLQTESQRVIEAWTTYQKNK